MPMLPPEPNVYPAGLFAGAEVTSGRDWWVLHTKPRQEKALARELLSAAIPFYLPLLNRKTMLRGRVLDSYVPLFTSYLFLLAEGDERIAALSTRRVVQSLEVRRQQELWDDLTRVNRLLDSGLPVTPEQRLSPGVTVEITTGSLAGLKGKVVREAGRQRFVVQVDFIQQGASVIIEDFMLSAIKG